MSNSHPIKKPSPSFLEIVFLRHSTLWLAAAVFALSAWLLSYRMYVMKEFGDEGYFVGAAMRILSGEIIYRDFQHNYPPGRMYSLALLIKLFGQDLGVARSFWVACHSVAAAVGFSIARRLMPLPLALGVAFVITFNSVFQNKSVELAVAALILLVLVRTWEGRTGDLAAGVWLGVLTYFRHDVGVMGCMVFGLQTLLQAHFDSRDAHYLTRLRNRWSAAWRFAAAYGAVGSAFALFMLYHGALMQAFQDLALSGFQANVELSRPFPILVEDWSPSGIWEGIISNRVVFYTPPIVYAICGIYGLWAMFRTNDRVRAGQLFSAAVLGGLIFLQVLPRTDPAHLSKAYLPAHVLSFALISILVTAAASSARKARWSAAAVWLLLTIPAVAIPVQQFTEHAKRSGSLVEVLKVEFLDRDRSYAVAEFPHGKLMYNSKRARNTMARISNQIARYAHLRENESMLAYPAGALLNFLYGYRNPTRYDVLRPGELGNNDPAILESLMEQIRKERPRVLVRVDEKTNPELSGMLSRWAKGAGYKPYWGRRLLVWIREDP